MIEVCKLYEFTPQFYNIDNIVNITLHHSMFDVNYKY